MGKYDKHLLEDYTPEEFAEMDTYIDHWRDMNFSYAAVKQLEGKYLVQNRVTGEIYESAQFLYIFSGSVSFLRIMTKQHEWTISVAFTMLLQHSSYRYLRQSWQVCARQPVSSVHAY